MWYLCQKEQTSTSPHGETPSSLRLCFSAAKVHTVHHVVDHPKNIYVGEKVHVYDVVHKVACLVGKKKPLDVLWLIRS